MKSCRPPLFWKRKFEPEVIVTCVRWYLRFCLSLRDLEELMAERGLAVDHTTVWRWTQAYGPEVYRRLHGQLKRKSSTWHIDWHIVLLCYKRTISCRIVLWAKRLRQAHRNCALRHISRAWPKPQGMPIVMLL